MKKSGEASGVVTFSVLTDQLIVKASAFLLTLRLAHHHQRSIENFSKDRDGRIVSINLIFKTANISLCNVYAPNDSQQQQKFLHNLNEYLMSNMDTSNLIIGGDWNVALQSLDKRGCITHKCNKNHKCNTNHKCNKN